MNARRSIGERRATMVFAGVALMLSIACGEPLARTNPYDPNVPVTIIIEGPDTIFNSFETVAYPARTDPAGLFSDTSFQYQSGNTQLLTVSQGGFLVVSTPLYPAAAAVTVTVGLGAFDTIPQAITQNGPPPHVVAYRHFATKTIYLSQRIKNIKLRCPDTHTCDPLAVGGAVSVWVDPTDSLGHQIQAYFSPVANSTTPTALVTYSVRDPSIASVVPLGTRVGTVTALKPGTTWIIGTRGTLVDSVQLVVH